MRNVLDLALWCKHASDHAKKIGAKPWKYLLIPHDLVTEDKRLVDFLAFEISALSLRAVP